jgi:membrane associated rhomboid family serine protease
MGSPRLHPFRAMPSGLRQAQLCNQKHDPGRRQSVLRLIGIIVAIAIGVMALWLLVDRAMYRWGGIGALIFGFLLVFLLFYLADRRKIKESENLIAERRGLG